MLKLKIIIIAAVLLIFLGSLASADFAHDVKEYQLNNGLKILLLENHDAPLIAYYTFYKVGARNERPGITGLSHFTEHMMFNGAKKYGPKMFDLLLENNGGYSNAYTSKNITAYYQIFTPDILELVIDLEADRLANLAFDSEMLESERGVVKEERLVGSDNDNSEIVWEELFAAAYMAHSYSWPVIGWMADIENYNREECLKYFRTYYVPNNAVTVIVGDFDADQAYNLLKKYMQDIPRGLPQTQVVRNEPPQRGPRRVTVEKPAQHVHFMRGYHIGDKDSPDMYAMEILEYLLLRGESSRMYQTMVNDLEIALSQWGGYSWGFDPSLFYFYIGAVPGVGVNEIEQAFDSVINEFTINGPTEDELTRAKNSLTAKFYKNYKTVEGIAHQIGYYQTLFNEWHQMYDYTAQIRKVTVEDIKQVAGKYFTRKNSTTAVLVPEQRGAL